MSRECPQEDFITTGCYSEPKTSCPLEDKKVFTTSFDTYASEIAIGFAAITPADQYPELARAGIQQIREAYIRNGIEISDQQVQEVLQRYGLSL